MPGVIADVPASAALRVLTIARRIVARPDLTASVPVVDDERSWLRLDDLVAELDETDVSAWIIRWPPGAGTGWHDHGGSSGAMVIVGGELTEWSVGSVWSRVADSESVPLPDGVGRRRRLTVGTDRAFGPWYIHEVVNQGDEAAFSVHVYSPRLPLMRRYLVHDGALWVADVETATEW
jgi:predicted metal-dependent enzyme (double-stranded beta helix superfamily)